MRRRDLLTSLAAGVAGAVVSPGLTTHSHASEDAPPQTTAKPAPAATPPPSRLLDNHRRDMLAGLADRILPGTRAAGVASLLDRVLAVEPLSVQRRFLNALGAFEREARDRHAKGWAEITGAEQVEILRTASTQASARPVSPGWTRGQPIERPAATDEVPANLRDHFDHLKDWVQRAYFTTAAGMKEYGFTGATAFESFPGCPHPGNVHT